MKNLFTKSLGPIAFLIWICLGCTPELPKKQHQAASSPHQINEIQKNIATKAENIASTLKKSDVDKALQKRDRITLKRWLHHINPQKYPRTVLYIQKALQTIRFHD
ncbi:MAG: hypothetical protein HQM14_08370 [SAR324 cluster bacterium]|nr:hypothetical protein [SAR324 cluster bacterium]